MSTRACYVFSDKAQPIKTFVGHVVYKHHDGYPSGAVEHLVKTLPFSWPFPRFEADEFAAAFVAANKADAGGMRLFGHGLWSKLISSDSEYVYFVAPNDTGMIIVRAIDAGTERVLFEQPLATIRTAEVPEDEE